MFNFSSHAQKNNRTNKSYPAPTRNITWGRLLRAGGRGIIYTWGRLLHVTVEELRPSCPAFVAGMFMLPLCATLPHIGQSRKLWGEIEETSAQSHTYAHKHVNCDISLYSRHCEKFSGFLFNTIFHHVSELAYNGQIQHSMPRSMELGNIHEHNTLLVGLYLGSGSQLIL